MRTRQRRSSAPVILVMTLALLLSAFGSSVVTAQTGDPPADTGQVIAHGVDTLPGATARWELGIITAPVPGNNALFGSYRTGFAAGWEQPVIATEGASGTSTYLEPGQAVFHPGNSTLRVTSTTGVDEGFIYIELTTAEPSVGAEFTGDAFTAPAGTHDVRLTSGILQPDTSSRFEPVNALPYLVYAYDGALQVAADNGTIVDVPAGGATQVVGPASLWASPDAGAHWMVASIGAQVDVPPLPAPVTPTPAPVTPAPEATTGSLVIQLLRCPDGTDPLIAPTECMLSDIVWDITLSPQGNTDPAAARTLVNDAVDTGDMAYRFTDLAAGTWVVQPDMSGMTPEQRIEMTGDIVPLGGIWGVEITAGAESEIYAYLIDPQATTGTGGLTIEMYDCEPGTDPLSDPSTCSLAADTPNVEVSRITQSESIVYNTLWDAVSPQAGVFTLDGIESGTFMLIPEDDGLWTADWITMSGDAYWDTSFWQVDVPDGGSAYVSIFHVPPGPPEPTEETDVSQGIGRLWITQIDCPPGTGDPLAEPACIPSEAPWEVVVTSAETGETWSLYENSTLALTGSWEFTLPAGSYYIDVYYDESWQVVYETFATVTEGGLTEISVYSIAP